MCIDWSDRYSGEVVKLPIDYSLPFSENVKNISKWLKAHSQKNPACYVVMYHATGKDSPVFEQGLLAGCSKRRTSSISESGYIYLSVNPNYARGYGKLKFPDGCVIYEVIVSVKKLLADKLHFYYARPNELITSNLVNSLVYGGSARVKGNIERWQIKQYSEEKPSLLDRINKKQEVKSGSDLGIKPKKNYERG